MQKVTLSDTHLILTAANNAERAALLLFSIASAVYPGDNENLINYSIREAIEAGITLGLNARKVIELCHLGQVHFTQTRWRYDFDPRARETSFRNATDRFVLAKQLKVRTLRHPQQIFRNDIVITEFIITTDRKEPAYIDVFGFACAYLSQIAPQIAPQTT
jgi:hypothetical protein